MAVSVSSRRLRLSDRQLLATLRRHGKLSRDQLVLLSGLPRSTVTDALARLRKHGIVVEQAMPRTPGRAGRPAKLLALGAPAGLVGVIALTHQTLQAAVTDMDGTVHARRLVEPYAYDADAGLPGPGMALLDQALRDVSRTPADLACAVVGVPMPVSGTAGAARPAEPRAGDHDPPDLPPAKCWIPLNITAEIGEHLGVPVWMENDANLGALGEGAFGAAAGMENFIYIKLAHGIGAGLVLGGRLYRGADGLAGELAHIHVEADGSLCPCGGRGCLMTTFNTPRLVDWLRTVHPGVGAMADVLALAADRDAGVCRILRDVGCLLGRSLADFCVYLAPDGIVLDGILENAAIPVIDGIRQMLSQHAPPAIVPRVRIAGGVLGHDAELRGAAVLARGRYLGEVS
jgi:predicted NBD/HSP70 family sugar kinase